MLQKRDKLINQLVTRLNPVTSSNMGPGKAMTWIVGSILVVTFLTLISQPFRTGFEEQLMAVPRFALETIIGGLAIFLMGLTVLKLSVPGASSSLFTGLTIAVTLLWLASYLVGLYIPTLEPSMAGKRPHCVWETILYSLPTIAAGFLIIRKGYVINWTLAGFFLGLTAGLIPAWLMQLACMYAPAHILLTHIAPALVVAMAGMLAGYVFQRWSIPP